MGRIGSANKRFGFAVGRPGPLTARASLLHGPRRVNCIAETDYKGSDSATLLTSLALLCAKIVQILIITVEEMRRRYNGATRPTLFVFY